jgi:hypothetical protein
LLLFLSMLTGRSPVRANLFETRAEIGFVVLYNLSNPSNRKTGSVRFAAEGRYTDP